MSNGSLILENVNLKNVGIAVQGAGSVTALAGTTGSMTIAAWGQGHIYDGTGSHTAFQGPIPPFSRPSGILDGQKYYERSKPSYAHIPVSRFLSARTHGATGNGIVDDTKALQKAINAAASAGKVLFIDAGTYKVTNTLHIPTGSKIVGESYPVIMSSGSYFANMHSPKPVIQVGRPDSSGCMEWSDMVVATQGHQPGAILIEWNLSTSGTPSGMWDVHTRIGGFKGSKLQLADCPATPALPSNGTSGGNSSMSTAPFSNSTTTGSGSLNPGPSPSYNNSTGGDNTTDTSYINKACIAAFMSMHITPSAKGLYMENNWFWTADHDLDAIFTNITVYSGRGLYIESESGDIWLYALPSFALPNFTSPSSTFLPPSSKSPHSHNYPVHGTDVFVYEQRSNIIRAPLPLPIPILPHPLYSRLPAADRNRLLPAPPRYPRTLPRRRTLQRPYRLRTLQDAGDELRWAGTEDAADEGRGCLWCGVV